MSGLEKTERFARWMTCETCTRELGSWLAGDKGSQARDIKLALELARALRE